MQCHIRRCALCAGCTEFHHNPSLGDPPKTIKKSFPAAIPAGTCQAPRLPTRLPTRAHASPLPRSRKER